MAIKSSTKRRLIDLGVDVDIASKLADDANMDMIKMMSAKEISAKSELKEGSNEFEQLMGIIREQSASKRRSRSKRVTLPSKVADDDDIPMGDTRFNVLNHELVPHHELVPEDEEKEALSPWDLIHTDVDGVERLAKELLPKILITDPAVQVLKEVHEQEDEELRAGWLANRVVRIIRRSPSAGKHLAYRLVVEGT